MTMNSSLERKITELAWRDSTFSALIETDPYRALAQIGVEVPEGVKLDVRRQRRDTLYYVIPPHSGDADKSESVINQMDLWQSAELFVWIMPQKLKVQLLAMRQSYRRNNSNGST
ncbi:hypothetical protein OB236_20460 [Paenibacillus sp. WQ 127069]|uniref:Nitrile hydratase alpha /Thiocyanate hydrolase gamma domain-containing protein n=1 Tax=Paenibacillus baimaensis TaxID=2982185 RepID=A0ABT2UIM1_9BACL|nr:hypothetical protein [Paenibacillus sp. WQ 127069]MCU6794485.1 hypothetical protein [Paenibacillus sp. WQ 127069]